MRNFLPFTLSLLLLASCNQNNPQPDPDPQPQEPEGTTVTFSESDEIFPNPERGLFAQIYYTSADLNSHADATIISRNRESQYKLTLYLHSYYLTDYMESDIPQEFLDRLETNMNALREGGAKVVLRFSYKSSMNTKDKPWNATPEWISKHMDQIAPYLQKHADVIYCVQCGWIGSWGEWYYTDNYGNQEGKMNANRKALVDALLDAVPQDRCIQLRTPLFKTGYVGSTSPLNSSEAYKGTAKSRLAHHNDAFLENYGDMGTYTDTAKQKPYIAQETLYVPLGGESCILDVNVASSNASFSERAFLLSRSPPILSSIR